MARQARKVSPTNHYHVMMRGNNREKIFVNDEQKGYFIESLIQLINEEPIEIIAYCLMDNHVHLIIKGEITDLSRALKRLSIKYAMRYNRAADRVGHVFQDRYRSEVIIDEAYLLHAIRYVHNNPVKAGIVDHPSRYLWNSYKDYENITSRIVNDQQKELILGYFSANFNRFEEFHYEEDYGEHLDTKEDVDLNRIQAADKIIVNYCKEEGVKGKNQILKNTESLNKLIKELLDKTRLSHRQIATILGISNNIVHKVSKGE